MLVISGCGSDADSLPEWRPEDHAQPEQHSTGQVPTAPNGGGEPVDPAEAQRRAVAAFFRMTCGPCHGAEGRGDGPMRTPEMQMPDLTSADWQRSRDDEVIGTSIAQGRGLMPGFGDRLPPPAIAALVAHVRSLGER
jgi:mono/diheme cytochrome c family protein